LAVKNACLFSGSGFPTLEKNRRDDRLDAFVTFDFSIVFEVSE